MPEHVDFYLIYAVEQVDTFSWKWTISICKRKREKLFSSLAPNPFRAVAFLQFPHSFSPHLLSFCPSKIMLFNIQVDLQIAILYESHSLWGFALNIFIILEIHLQMKPLQEVCPSPVERQDGSPLFLSMGVSEQGRGARAQPAHHGWL